jgi:hypothetical protein
MTLFLLPLEGLVRDRSAGTSQEGDTTSSQATPAGPTIAVRAAQLKRATKAIKNLERARTASSL